MYKLTFITGRVLHTLTNPKHDTLRHIREVIKAQGNKTARLWDKNNNLMK